LRGTCRAPRRLRAPIIEQERERGGEEERESESERRGGGQDLERRKRRLDQKALRDCKNENKERSLKERDK